MGSSIKKILIANRGEIALRVIRTAREMNIKTVAVFSEPDFGALHMREADEAFCLGPAAPSESYLNIEKLIEVAKKSGADAIHPGYGFLSENAAFSKACEDAGITFMGPDAQTISLMGDKMVAKKRMMLAGVPVIPGSEGLVKNLKEAETLAAEINFPLLVKAVAGGGGRGMRRVNSMEELKSAFEGAVSEAETAFGNGAVLLEKFIENPHHVEVQIMGDGKGKVLHYFERECSVQRRHQKLLEETPSPLLAGDQDVLEKMYEAAVKAGESVNYRGAGTVEFVVDQKKNFYFLEMNTRLQVEHPVTEMITGVDLVREMVHVADGTGLTMDQKNIQKRGHSIEFRILAEDSETFLPNPGKIEEIEFPFGPFVRVDHGVFSGWELPRDYDSMFAKLIVYGATRDEAIERGRRALSELRILGPRTTIAFHQKMLKEKAFIEGKVHTGWLEQRAKEGNPVYKHGETQVSDDLIVVACEYRKEIRERNAQGNMNAADPSTRRWKQAAIQEGMRS